MRVKALIKPSNEGKTWPNTKFSHREFLQNVWKSNESFDVDWCWPWDQELILNPKKAFNLSLMNVYTSHCTHPSTNSDVILLENAIHRMHNLLYCAWWVCCPQSKSYLTLFQMDDQSFLALWKRRSKQITIRTVM